MLIFREILLVGLALSLRSQRRSLWGRLIIIPMRLAIIYSTVRVNSFSGLIMVMYIIIFIGGLLVLLVRIASISFQEQGYNLDKLILSITVMFLIPFFRENKMWSLNSAATVMRTAWFEEQSNNIWSLVFLLRIALIVITGLFLKFKGLVRGL